MLVAPSSSQWNVFLAVGRFSTMKLSNILRFSTRCETVVALPMFALSGLGGIVPKPVMDVHITST